MEKEIKRKKRRLGALDVCIGLLLLLSILQPILRLLGWEHASQTKNAVEATVSLQVRNVPKEMEDCLTVGEVLRTASGEVYGVLEAVESTPARVTLIENGQELYGAWEDGTRVDLTLRVTVSGSMSDGRFLLFGRSAILRGNTVRLYGKYAMLCGTVTSIFPK